MRRMPTTKQLEYVNELSQVAEKGFKVGTYPEEITDIAGVFDFNWSWATWEDEEAIDFEDHCINGSCYFEFPSLYNHYGLEGEVPGDLPWTCLFCNTFDFPETINTKEDLKNYLKSAAGMSALADHLDENFGIDEFYVRNQTADYSFNDYAGIFVQNGQIIFDGVSITCNSGEGEEIENAPDPIGENTLKTNYLEADNIISNQIKTWYFIEGNFTSNADVLYIIITQKAVYNNQRKRYICWAINNDDDSINEYDINFTNGKIYDSAGIEINLDSATVQLINALNGDVEDEVDL